MAEKKCRQYSNECFKYGFIPSPTNRQLPLCLACEKAFTNEAMKPSRLSEHLAKMHSDKVGKPISFFQGLKSKFENRSTVGKVYGTSALNADKGLLASFKVSLLIAQCGKAHTIGETIVLPTVKELVTTMLGPDACAMVKLIPLSNDTVSRRIDEMAADVKETLLDVLKNTEFLMQIDEAMVRDNEALLLAYVHFINRNEEVVEELLFTRILTTNTKGSSIYKRVEEFFQYKNIPLINVLACVTHRVAFMIGRYRGFIAHLKSAIPGIMAVHFVIHQQNLVAKQLYHDEEFERLLLHIEVRWLSRGKCLRHFNKLFDTVVEFFRPIDASLCYSIELRCLEVAYLADIFEKLNKVNTKQQENKMNFIKAKERNNFQDADLDVFCSHLKQAKEDMETRFNDLYAFEIP
ncbi:hypothetical protein GDO78_002054, partial [Eleutherodactylus coqui]